MGGGFDGGLQRSDIAIAYIPIEDLDKAAADNKLPAQTVIPLRMIVVNCTIPMKKQLEELKRAMRFQTIDQARPYLKYDGFEVKRKITQIRPTGEVVVIQDWANYKYEDKYVELINSRRLSDHVEGTDKTNKQGPYLPYFYRYEDSLVMPLPELVPELGSYPHIRLKSIVETIDKLESGRTPKVDPSDLIKRLQQKGSRKDLFNLSGASDTGAGDLFGKGGPGGGIMDIGKVGAPGKGGNEAKGGGLENQQQVNIDELLLRFVDCDVQPGLAYEYQIQLLMVNPNFGPSQIPNVSNPVDTKKRILTSQWIPLPGSLIVPTEDFLYAYDRNAYFSEIAENYKTQKILQGFLQVKENQTVVQAVKWMESIRMEGKHEPIGGWVVAEIPVGRGDYIGKKTYVKLPLWSSESNQYILREIPGEIIKKAKDQQPRGWMVDFSSKSILVDFDGGKVTTRTASGRTLPIEEVATEMLIVRSDGKLAVRRSIDDSLDQNRKDLTGIWDGWIKKVEARPTSTGTDTGGNAFDRKP